MDAADSPKDILIGIDLGTSSARVVAFDLDGKTLAAATREYPLHTPKPNWAEQDPADWVEGTFAGLRAVTSEIDPNRVGGVSFSGQMHGSVFLDAKDEVIRPALLWCDGRTASQCQWAMETVGKKKFLSVIKNPALTSFTLPKLIWLRDSEPKNFKRLRTVLLPKDYVRFRLTGVKAMEVSDGAGTAMMKVGKKKWADKVLKALGLDPATLPPLMESMDQAGSITAEAARATGLIEGTPVFAGAGDQPAGAIGVGVIREGQAMVSVGTSGVIFAPTGKAELDPTLALATFDHAVPGVSYLMGCILSAGGALQWFRNQLCPEEMAAAQAGDVSAYDIMLKGAASVEPGAEGLTFLPYLMGERSPHNDPDARGAFVGLTVRHTRAHMTRAVIEGVSFALRDCLESARALGVEVKEIRATGGGARSPFWMQMMSDILGVKINCVDSPEGPALGAAILAGVGSKLYPSFSAAVERAVRLGQSYKPAGARRKEYEKAYQRFRGLYPALKGRF